MAPARVDHKGQFDNDCTAILMELDDGHKLPEWSIHRSGRDEEKLKKRVEYELTTNAKHLEKLGDGGRVKRLMEQADKIFTERADKRAKKDGKRPSCTKEDKQVCAVSRVSFSCHPSMGMLLACTDCLMLSALHVAVHL